ncbi:Coq4 family protein [Sorangium sp. So ce291]|uniref:Coq4 family protein n=1 Tax=Sorangium sp. So ce291 TaxID=3133294 RepID=UPI003F60AE8D
MTSTARHLDIHDELPHTAPLPPRGMEWRKAFRLAKECTEKPFTAELSYELILSLDGGATERMFQDFLAEPGARALILKQPDLAATLADTDLLGSMPEGSLGRTYKEMAERDGYAVNGIIHVMKVVPTFHEVAPDPLRQWFSFRGAVLHDVAHALTGYGRDLAGEVALGLFLAAIYPPYRSGVVYSFISGLAAVTAPQDRKLRNVSYLREVWIRGRRSRIPLSAPWEELLPLQVEEVCRMFQVPLVRETHAEGILRDAHEKGPWVPSFKAQSWA